MLVLKKVLGLRWARWTAAVATGLLAILAGALAALGAGPVAVEQPLAFNHAVHARLNTACDVCHRGCLTTQAAGRPKAAICAECHDPAEEALGSSGGEQALRGILAGGEEIAWRRLAGIAPDVRFSHAVHAGRLQIGCELCHGPIGTTEAPPQAAFLTFSMDECLRCHQEKQATEDCLSCHR